MCGRLHLAARGWAVDLLVTGAPGSASGSSGGRRICLGWCAGALVIHIGIAPMCVVFFLHVHFFFWSILTTVLIIVSCILCITWYRVSSMRINTIMINTIIFPPWSKEQRIFSGRRRISL
jgi:hypothetical protein